MLFLREVVINRLTNLNVYIKDNCYYKVSKLFYRQNKSKELLKILLNLNSGKINKICASNYNGTYKINR